MKRMLIILLMPLLLCGCLETQAGAPRLDATVSPAVPDATEAATPVDAMPEIVISVPYDGPLPFEQPETTWYGNNYSNHEDVVYSVSLTVPADGVPFGELYFRDSTSNTRFVGSFTLDWTQNSILFSLDFFSERGANEPVLTVPVLSARYRCTADSCTLSFNPIHDSPFFSEYAEFELPDATLTRSQRGRYDNDRNDRRMYVERQPHTEWEIGSKHFAVDETNTLRCIDDADPIALLRTYDDEHMIIVTYSPEHGGAYTPLLYGYIDQEWADSITMHISKNCGFVNGELSELDCPRTKAPQPLHVGASFDVVRADFLENGGRELTTGMPDESYGFAFRDRIVFLVKGYGLCREAREDGVAGYAVYDLDGNILECVGVDLLDEAFALGYEPSADKYFPDECGVYGLSISEDGYLYFLPGFRYVLWTCYHEGPGGDYSYVISDFPVRRKGDG